MSNPAWGVQPYPKNGVVVTPVREVEGAEEAPGAAEAEAPPAAEAAAEEAPGAAEAEAAVEAAARPEAEAAWEAPGSSWSSRSTAACTPAACRRATWSGSSRRPTPPGPGRTPAGSPGRARSRAPAS